MEGRLYLRLLLRNRVPILLITILGIVAGGALYAVAPATYRSSMTFTVQSAAGSNDPSQIYQAELLSQARAQTYARLVDGQALADRVRAKMASPVSTQRLLDDLSASTAPASVLLHVTVTDRSAAVVNATREALTRVLPAYVTSLQPRGAAQITSVAVAAAPVAQKIGPTKARYVGLGLLGGLLLGLLVALVREAANRRVRDAEDVRSVVGAGPAVVSLSRSRRLRRKRGIDPAVALTGVIARASADARPLAFVPLPAGRRAASAMIDLARRFAVGGQRLALIDADVDGRYLTTFSPVEARLSMADVEAPAGSAFPPSAPSVVVVPAEALMGMAGNQMSRQAAPRTDGGLIGAAVGKAAAALQGRVDLTVVAAANVLFRARPSFLSSEPSESILFVHVREATKAELATAVDVLTQLGCRVGAVVLIAGSSPRRGNPSSSPTR